MYDNLIQELFDDEWTEYMLILYNIGKLPLPLDTTDFWVSGFSSMVWNNQDFLYWSGFTLQMKPNLPKNALLFVESFVCILVLDEISTESQWEMIEKLHNWKWQKLLIEYMWSAKANNMNFKKEW